MLINDTLKQIYVCPLEIVTFVLKGSTPIKEDTHSNIRLMKTNIAISEFPTVSIHKAPCVSGSNVLYIFYSTEEQNIENQYL